jgi:hypothetical protein
MQSKDLICPFYLAFIGDIIAQTKEFLRLPESGNTGYHPLYPSANAIVNPYIRRDRVFLQRTCGKSIFEMRLIALRNKVEKVVMARKLPG